MGFFPTLIQSSTIPSCASIHCILSACPGSFVLKERAETIPSRSLSLQGNSILSSLLNSIKRTGSEHLHWGFLPGHQHSFGFFYRNPYIWDEHSTAQTAVGVNTVETYHLWRQAFQSCLKLICESYSILQVGIPDPPHQLHPFHEWHRSENGRSRGQPICGFLTTHDRSVHCKVQPHYQFLTGTKYLLLSMAALLLPSSLFVSFYSRTVYLSTQHKTFQCKIARYGSVAPLLDVSPRSNSQSNV